MKALCGILFALISLVPNTSSALLLREVSDTISTSQKSVGADHMIEFTPPQAIAPGAQIVITPQAGAFTIPADLALGDIDLAVATSVEYVDRPLATSSDTTFDGVTIVPGVNGSIRFTLNTAEGINAYDHVLIRIGTVATFEEQGDVQILNPSAVASYKIGLTTTNASLNRMDTSNAMIAIVEQVGLRGTPVRLETIRFNGFPSGEIAAGNSSIELSLQSDVFATCRYSTFPNIDYASMTTRFVQTSSKLHTVVLSGFVNDNSYAFYVRCKNVQNTINSDDFTISFRLLPTPGTRLSLDDGTASGAGGGGSGAGDFVNGSKQLYLASIALTGWTIPLSTVSILLDGKQQTPVRAKSDGSFRAELTNLERGTHTVSAFATDSTQHRTGSFTSTLTLDPATNNVIANAVIPPTIVLDTPTVPLGDMVRLHGESAPGSVDILLVKEGDAVKAGAKIFHASTTSEGGISVPGTWEYTLDTKGLPKGVYLIKARTIRSRDTDSDYGRSVALGLGQEAPKDTGNRSDINKDGKVNLVDFSIMLVSWGGDDPDADINQDGKVNLADFSIMLFNWTG